MATGRLRWWWVLGVAAAILAATIIGYVGWQPGATVEDGRHDRGRNGMWLQHGWLGDDAWFRDNRREARKPSFRSAEGIAALAGSLRAQRIADVFPHLCPAEVEGDLPACDPAQVERLLDALAGIRVLPWIGGVHGENALIEEPAWRDRFVAATVALLERHPRFAGVHLNIEPCPSGNRSFLTLLDALRSALPSGRVLSVAAYPPPTAWQPVSAIHWDEGYYRAVASRCDQLVVMAYDTGLKLRKPYQRLVAAWTVEVLAWSAPTPVLIGLPAYDDIGVGYHHLWAENVGTALGGLHAGLLRAGPPQHYQGAALYCEWEMEPHEWEIWRRSFLKR